MGYNISKCYCKAAAVLLPIKEVKIEYRLGCALCSAGDRELVQVAQRSCRLFIPGDFQKAPGHSPLGVYARARIEVDVLGVPFLAQPSCCSVKDHAQYSVSIFTHKQLPGLHHGYSSVKAFTIGINFCST